MRKGLALSLVGVILAGAGGWYWVAHEPSRPSPGGTPGSATQRAVQPFWDSWNVHKGRPSPAKAPFHFYDPLKGPPPRVSLRQRIVEKDRFFRELIFKELQPDLTGRPLAASYKAQAAQANRGNVQAATNLFNGLMYCKFHSLVLPAGSRGLERKIVHMRATREDMFGKPTDHPEAAVKRFQAVNRYCAGETHLPQKTIDHWARIALWSLNPITIYNVFNWAPHVLRKHMQTGHQFTRLRREVNRRAAWAGDVQAWMEQARTLFGDQTTEHPVHRFADLYTAYLLTRSPTLARMIWKLSRGKFTDEEIREGEEIARHNYERIRGNEGH